MLNSNSTRAFHVMCSIQNAYKILLNPLSTSAHIKTIIGIGQNGPGYGLIKSMIDHEV